MNTNSHPRVGIGVLIFKDQELLLGQRQGSHGALSWSPPGGHLDFGESFEACACREVLEETGLILAQPRLLTVSNDIFVTENKHYVTLFLTAAFPQGQTIENREPEKCLSWQWFKVQALPENLFLPLKNLLLHQGNDFLLNIQNLSTQSAFI